MPNVCCYCSITFSSFFETKQMRELTFRNGNGWLRLHCQMQTFEGRMRIKDALFPLPSLSLHRFWVSMFHSVSLLYPTRQWLNSFIPFWYSLIFYSSDKFNWFSFYVRVKIAVHFYIFHRQIKYIVADSETRFHMLKCTAHEHWSPLLIFEFSLAAIFMFVISFFQPFSC